MSGLSWMVVLAGALLGLGLWTTLWGTRVPVARLGDALNLLDPSKPEDPRDQVVLVANEHSRLERMGAWVFRRSRLPLSVKTAARLSLQGRSVGDFFIAKTLFALAGLLLPVLFTTLLAGLVAAVQVPLLLGVGLGLAGWFLPDFQLRSSHETSRADAAQMIHTFIDLVMLERLANRSSSQALSSAAELSVAPVLQRVRAALTRARLEQRPPWEDLNALAEELELPQLADVADVMRLDDQGASLADTLAGRVKELRDAQLARDLQAAHQVSERMTIWMSIPVLIFALAFITPPMLRMAGIT